MHHLKVSRAVRPLKWSLGVKWLIEKLTTGMPCLKLTNLYLLSTHNIEACVAGNKSTKSPASGAGKVSESRLLVTSRESARNRVRVDQCVSAVRAVEVPVLVCVRSSCSHVTEVGGP